MIYLIFHKNKLKLFHLEYKGNFFFDTSSEVFTPHTKGVLSDSGSSRLVSTFYRSSEVKKCQVEFTVHK
jgi:hypothetical protein